MQRGIWRRLAFAIALGVAGSACAAIMGVEEPQLVEDDDVLPGVDGGSNVVDGNIAIEGGEILDDGGCLGAGCPCTQDPDCRAPFVKCGASRCVQCASTPIDTCPTGSYCTEENNCAIGCKTDDECETLTSGSSPFCDLARHRCVACLSSAHCSDGKACSPSGTCTNTCTGDDPSACAGANQACCGGFCVDITSDALNCGACGAACSTSNGQPTCNGAACSWTCDTGFMHCEQGNTGCETNTAMDPAHCGSCTSDCASMVVNASGIFCSVGSCSYNACAAGFANCDGNRANGCECACGGPGQRCCTGGRCNSVGDRCGPDDRCQPCGKKNAPCSAGNDTCCKGCGPNDKCK